MLKAIIIFTIFYQNIFNTKIIKLVIFNYLFIDYLNFNDKIML